MAGRPQRRMRREAEMLRNGADPTLPLITPYPQHRGKKTDFTPQAARAERASTPVVEDAPRRGRPPGASNRPKIETPIEEDAPELQLLRRALETETAPAGEAPVAERHVLFEKLSNLAIERAIDIMNIKLDPTQPGFEKVMARQSAIIATMMSAQVRVDKDSMRKRETDPVGMMLADLKKLGVPAANTAEPEELVPDIDIEDAIRLFD